MKFSRSNNLFNLISPGVELIKELPLGIYQINQDPRSLEFFLEKQVFDKFNLPDKLFGNTKELTKKVLKKYSLREKNLGVLLNGTKGSGKSLLAKSLCNEGQVPVLILKSYPDDGDFQGFISNLNFRFILFIDEFEKVVREEAQVKMLSVLDGWSESKMLTVMTTNEAGNLSRYLDNRSSRIHYRFDFEGLTTPELEEVIDYHLVDAEHKSNLLKVCSIVGTVNYDVLISLIGEVNEMGYSDPNELMYAMNIHSESVEYLIVVTDNKGNKASSTRHCAPLAGSFYFEGYWEDSEGNDITNAEGYPQELDERFEYSDYITVTAKIGGCVITTADYTFTFTEVRKAGFTF